MRFVRFYSEKKLISRLFFPFFVGRSATDDASIKKQLQNAQEIFLELNSKATNAAKRLALLNSFVKLIDLSAKDGLIGFTTEEILYW